MSVRPCGRDAPPPDRAKRGNVSRFVGLGGCSETCVWQVSAGRRVDWGCPQENDDAAGEDRTPDLRIMRPTRCQLRYCRGCCQFWLFYGSQAAHLNCVFPKQNPCRRTSAAHVQPHSAIGATPSSAGTPHSTKPQTPARCGRGALNFGGLAACPVACPMALPKPKAQRVGRRGIARLQRPAWADAQAPRPERSADKRATVCSQRAR